MVAAIYFLLFFGPGPDVNDFAVLTTGGELTVVPWAGDSFAVPVVGSFDPADLDRDVARGRGPANMKIFCGGCDIIPRIENYQPHYADLNEKRRR